MPLVYFDNCALQRPLDDRAQFRVRVEAEAVETVISEIAQGRVALLSSDVLLAESGAAPNGTRQEFAALTLALAAHTVFLSSAVEALARTYRNVGIKSIDAIHLASAVDGNADYFRTTDDRFRKRAARANTEAMSVVTPQELAFALGL